jgi:hypothetical protein
MKPKTISIIFLIALALSLLAGCAAPGTQTAQPTATVAAAVVEPTSASTKSATETASGTGGTTVDTTKDDAYADALTFNNSAWNYDADHDVYWQIGVQYCATPAATDYETLGIYVPGVYITATANGDGTYTARVNEQGSLNGFTAKTAPMVFPVNTPGYSAQQAPTTYNYDSVSSYLEAGFIYVAAGMRGKDNGYDASGQLSYSGGAPWGVTDFKAAVRFIRYNQAVLPGNAQSIFAFGMSGGGAQTAVIGASGDSQLYYPYLEAIGAAMYDANGQSISDAVMGAMAWCPITSLDYANEAYEWNMGQYSTSGTRADGTFTAALSKDLAAAYAEYINQLGLTDENGNALTLQTSESGVYTAGSYYDYLVKTVETSLNHFLADTTFPYTETVGGFMRPSGGLPAGGTPPAGGRPQGTPPAGGMPGGSASSTTYQTVQEYMDALNMNGQWVIYDAATNTAKITSLAGFVNSQKSPSKSAAAFDSLDRSSPENGVFGNDENDALHFDSLLANLLAANQAEYAQYADWNAAYVEEYAMDLQAVDQLGNNLQYRIDMYNPMYYLLPYYAGYQTSTVAPYWRINTGIKQGDTATTVEMNMALALENYAGVNEVDFTTVWGQAHVLAERTGDSTTNFIAWVIQITQK